MGILGALCLTYMLLLIIVMSQRHLAIRLLRHA
jgi:hypothetical protein